MQAVVINSLCPRCEGRGTEHRQQCSVCLGRKTVWEFTPAMELEMQYTTWEMSCKDPAVIHGDLRNCRRPGDHEGRHASGFRTNYREWGARV